MAGLLLEHVSHAFDGVAAVDDVSLGVAPGEVVCLLGPSGCGKTTTLRVAAGLERLQRGRVLIDERVLATADFTTPPEERHVGLVFQDYALFPHLTVLGNVAFGVKGPSRRRRDRARAMLERVRMAQHADNYPHMLSGGEQQRVALVRALAPQPGLMLMDEPFSGLDVRLRDRVRDDTLAVLKETGTATLLVTHDPEEAMRMADRIAVMQSGRVAQLGTPVALYERPASAFIARFFSEINAITAVVKAGRVATPLGPLPARGFAEGAAVEVLARPEALRLDLEGVPTKVTAARTLGPYGLVHLRVDAAPADIVMRTGPGAIPRIGDELRIAVDADKAFIFPIS